MAKDVSLGSAWTPLRSGRLTRGSPRPATELVSSPCATAIGARIAGPARRKAAAPSRKARSHRHLEPFRVDAFQRGSYLPKQSGPKSSRGVRPTQPIRSSIFALTDRGKTRDHNEDTFLVADLATAVPGRTSHFEQHQLGERGALYLVADGMGGAAAGELASEMAAIEIHRYMVDVWRADPEVSEARFARHLRTAVERANLRLHEYAVEHPDVRGMGTTATVVGVWADRLYLAQIGDSRAYLVRGDEARQLTRDQSLTQRLVEVGELTEEEAEASERRNIILQALGPDERVKVDVSFQPLQRGDVLIICSDGLSTVVRRDEIVSAVQRESDLSRLTDGLVRLANERGGPDNITVVSVRFDGEGLPQSASEEPGYHEFLITDERPALLPTAAFPAAAILATPITPLRPGSPTGMALVAIGIVMAILALILIF